MTHAIDLDGQTFFHDRVARRELANRMGLQIDLDTAVVSIGAAGDTHREELVFDDIHVRHALRRMVDALRRHAYRTREVRMVPKPARPDCAVCNGTGAITNPYSGERFTCPSCG